jgi:1-acyl-sn-glycerol-3-phosphate acyltransferase
MIRGLVYWFFGSLVTLAWGIFLFVSAPFVRRREDFFHNKIGLWAMVLLRILCGVRLNVQGIENIAEDESYIIVSNHRSYTDILVGNAAIPIQFRWLAKKSLFRIPIIGWSMHFAGYIPVIRERAVSASHSLQRTAEVLRSGTSVWMFPEGTRTPERVLGNFKRGAFRLARETGLPLLPVVFTGTDHVFVKPWIIKPLSIGVRVLQPIDPKQFGTDGSDERAVEKQLMEAARDIIQRSYDGFTSQSR